MIHFPSKGIHSRASRCCIDPSDNWSRVVNTGSCVSGVCVRESVTAVGNRCVGYGNKHMYYLYVSYRSRWIKFIISDWATGPLRGGQHARCTASRGVNYVLSRQTPYMQFNFALVKLQRRLVVKVRRDSHHWSGLSPLLLMKKCSFVHKMCQIPHPHPRLRPLSPLLDLAALTTGLSRCKL